ncbi:translocation/assembly module TamB domain-containing protein [Cruoricaptor ignavus]|nr:translocation/assembly module TamB domain-containing protein [Cruoricaptor ignavus]
MKARLLKILRVLAIILLSVLALVFILIGAVQMPGVQNALKNKLVSYLEEKVKTNVELERLAIKFPNSLVMENLYLQGQDVDTLLFAKKFDVGLDIPALLRNEAKLTSIDLEKIRANVVRREDGSFNFDYFVDAFTNKEEKSSESKPFILSLDKIKLQDIGVSFRDEQARNDMNVRFRYFDTRVKKFDIDQNTYAIGDIVMDGLKFRLKQDLLEEVAEKADEKVDSLREKKPMRLDLAGIKFTNFDIDFQDENSRMNSKILFRELNTKVKKIDIERNDYEIPHLLLSGANIDLNLYTPPTNGNADPEAKNDRGNPMTLVLGKGKLQDVKLRYNNTAVGRQAGLDPNHLDVSKLNLELWNFKMNEGQFAGTINSAEIQEKSGLNIQKLHTDFLYAEKQAYLKSLLLQTPKTLLRDEIILDYNSIQELSQNPGNVKVAANIRNSKIAFSDILNLVPSLQKTAPFSTYPNAVMNLDTGIFGRLDDLQINRFKLTGIDKTVVLASGKIQNAVSNPDNLFFDLNIRELSSEAKTIYNLVPKGTIPQNISLPAAFTIRGTAKGFANNLAANLNLNSTAGNAKINARADLRRKGAELYDVAAELDRLNIGKITQNNQLGLVSGKVIAKGQNFDVMKGTAQISGNLSAFDFNGYRYQNVRLDGKLNHGSYRLNLDSKDANANLKLVASGMLRDNNPTIKMQGDLKNVDLYKLGFYKEALALKGSLSADFTNINPDFLNGGLLIDQLQITDKNGVYPLQEIRLTAVSNNEKNSLQLTSQIADVDLEGRYKLTEIGDALMQTVNEYYQISAPKKKISPGQYFDFSAKIKDDDLIRKFVPELKSFETIALDGNFAADRKSLAINAKIPQLQYGENHIENAALSVRNEGPALLYSLNAEELHNENLALNKVSIDGDVQNNTITYNLSAKDEKDETRFLAAGNLRSLGEITEVSLDGNLVLNYSKWQVAEGNKISIGKNGIIADQFVLTKNDSRIALQSETQSFTSPMNVEIVNFKIDDIAELLRKDELPASGTINGTAQIRDLMGKNLNLNADLNITDLAAYENPVGNVQAKISNSSAEILNADIRLTGYDNDVSITGTYNTAAAQFNLLMDMKALQMKSLQGLTQNQIKNAEGYLSGRLDITGSAEKPSILGSIKFNDVGMEIAQTGSNLRNLNDGLRFTNTGINFNRFRINDKDGNALVINGDVLTPDYKSFAFDLKVRADEFRAVDSEKDNDKMMYGLLIINADLTIGGNLDLPKVDGKLSITDKTDYTFVLPQSSPELQDREGIVEFIPKELWAATDTGQSEDLAEKESRLRGLDVNVNIEIKREAKISLLIDKANGDFVKLQGQGDLTAGVDPSGKTTLVGTYDVEEGAYEMSVSLIRRKFDIQKGSTIIWTGDPMLAQLDITAIYRTEAPPYDLVEQQISGMSRSEMNQYKQRIPFNTELKLTGELMEPVIKFDITMDEENNSVSSSVVDNTKARLEELRTDESEMNKQVFALLLLNRFIGENPFDSESGVSAEMMARQSVSKILSQQLNNLAGDLIQGVDLNFDLESSEDYSTGEKNTRTDLNVGVSKRLLNDRLKVTVGSNFALEGQARQNEQTTNIAGDVSLDYQLSRDGRYMLRAFRKNEYQVALQGQIVETGLSFIITLDYNEFKDIFQKSKKNRENRELSREIHFNESK